MSNPGRPYRLYVLAMLTTVYMVNVIDRAVMTLLLQPIKEDLRLSDTQLGFVTGLAFALFYAVMGVPIARWADRGNRVTITSVAIGLWGLTVMTTVFVTNYAQLVLARVAAAVGEAGCKPPTYSLLGDYFEEPKSRQRAMSVYLAGSPLAALLTFGLAGFLNEAIGWRSTFLIMGVPGLLLALVFSLTVREPRRTSEAPAPAKTRFDKVLILLWGQKPLRHLTFAFVILYTFGQGMGPWFASYILRTHAIGTAELGVWFGLTASIGGIFGLWLGGEVVPRWISNDDSVKMKINSVVILLAVPNSLAFLFTKDTTWALSLLLPLFTIFSFFLSSSYTLMQRLAPDAMRATVLSVVMLLANLIGMGVGPLLVGVLSDQFAPGFGNEALRWSMASLSIVLGIWSAVHFLMVGRSLQPGEGGSQARLPAGAAKPDFRSRMRRT